MWDKREGTTDRLQIYLCRNSVSLFYSQLLTCSLLCCCSFVHCPDPHVWLAAWKACSSSWLVAQYLAPIKLAGLNVLKFKPFFFCTRLFNLLFADISFCSILSDYFKVFCVSILVLVTFSKCFKNAVNVVKNLVRDYCGLHKGQGQTSHISRKNKDIQ